MSSDYGFINARVKGLKANLLDQEFYSEALASGDFAGFTSALAQSPYLPELEEAQTRYSGIRSVDSALARNFYRTTRSLLQLSDGPPGELVGLILLRYDLANIKAIARAKHAGREPDDTQAALLPAGELKPAVLEAVAAAPDMAAAAQALLATSTPLRTAFARAAAQYQSDGDLYTLEIALDRAYFTAIFALLKRVPAPASFERHLRREVDATNLRTALKLRGSGGTEELFIAGGREIDRSAFDAIAADPSPGALQVLAGTGFAAVGEVERLGAAEAIVRELVDRSAKRLAADPRGIGVVADFLRAKEAETARLRLLARGKFYGVPRAELAKELGDA